MMYEHKRISFLVIIIIFLLSFPFNVFASLEANLAKGDDCEPWPQDSESVLDAEDMGTGSSLTDKQELTEAGSPPLLASRAAVLMDAQTGQILYEKNMNRRMYPASITKILTALLAIESSQPEQIITLSEQAVFSIEKGSSHIALNQEEQITMEEALYALAIASANDAANGIAETVGGSLEGFADLMNQRAGELGATNSHFINAHGLPDDDHYTTAYDMALIMQKAIESSLFLDVFSEPMYEITPTNKQPEPRIMHSANCLVNGVFTCEGLIASKTGYTDEAGHTLVTAANRNGRTLIVVVLKSSLRNDKFNDTLALLDYGFNYFQELTIPASAIVTAFEGLIEQDTAKTIKYNELDDLQVLLHKDYNLDQVKISVEEQSKDSDQQVALASIQLDTSSPERKMYRQLATCQVEASFSDEGTSFAMVTAGEDQDAAQGLALQVAAQELEENGKEKKVKNKGAAIGRKLIIAALILTLLVVLAQMLKYNQHRRRRRKREYLYRKYNFHSPEMMSQTRKNNKFF